MNDFKGLEKIMIVEKDGKYTIHTVGNTPGGTTKLYQRVFGKTIGIMCSQSHAKAFYDHRQNLLIQLDDKKAMLTECRLTMKLKNVNNRTININEPETFQSFFEAIRDYRNIIIATSLDGDKIDIYVFSDWNVDVWNFQKNVM